MGEKGDGDFQISDLVRNIDGTDTERQIHPPHLHVGAPGIFSDLLSSLQMLNSEWDLGYLIWSKILMELIFNPW